LAVHLEEGLGRKEEGRPRSVRMYERKAEKEKELTAEALPRMVTFASLCLSNARAMKDPRDAEMAD